jgi:non-ribosomal peptide synthase protein (TIGR01720 family)
MILAALLLAYVQWSGKDYLHLNLVNNGRTVDAYGHDFSRTAGWISYMNPVVLRTGARDDCIATYQSVSRQIREVPRDNSFNILKYCHPSPEVRRRMHAIPEPQVNFNYFSAASGNHAEGQGGVGDIRFTSLSSALQPGVEIAVKAGGKLEHYMALTCEVAHGEVRMNWMYVVELFGEARMRRFSQLFDTSLREVVANAAVTNAAAQILQ